MQLIPTSPDDEAVGRYGAPEFVQTPDSLRERELQDPSAWVGMQLKGSDLF